jgi:hypothetical protein
MASDLKQIDSKEAGINMISLRLKKDLWDTPSLTGDGFRATDYSKDNV